MILVCILGYRYTVTAQAKLRAKYHCVSAHVVELHTSSVCSTPFTSTSAVFLCSTYFSKQCISTHLIIAGTVFFVVSTVFTNTFMRTRSCLRHICLYHNISLNFHCIIPWKFAITILKAVFRIVQFTPLEMT